MNDLAAAPKAVTDSGHALPVTSLIIASRNRPAMLAETVESVLHGDEVPTELIIIDQSAGEQAALARLKSERECEVRYQWSQSVGLSRARNEGVAAARQGVLVFIDDDMWVAATWFGALVRALVEAGPRSVVCGQVQPAERTGAFIPATKIDQAGAVYTAPGQVDVLYGGHLAVYRSAFDDIGLFDDRLGPGTTFPGGEDSDFGYRLLSRGYRIVYAPQAVLYHRGWRSDREYLRLRWNYGLGRGGFYAKHLSRHNSYAARRLAADVRNHIVSLPQRMWRERARAYGDLMLVAGILTGAARWVLKYGPTHRPR